MKTIKLTQGKVALVDDEDFDELNKYKWCVWGNGNNRYAVRGQRTIFMHRLIIKTPKGSYTDHIDGNGLNNQKKNLRIVSKSQNNMNKRRPRHNTSGYKGVSWYKKYQKWKAQIQINNVEKHIGYFKEKKEAAKAYDEACIKYHGEFANINFPQIIS